MGVFTVDDALRAAAIDAGHALGLFEALASPLALEALAARARVRVGHRFVALVDALVALGALVRAGDHVARGTIPPPSAHPQVGGWGAIADVIRTDTPLAIDPALAHRYHAHLLVAGAAAAREVAALVVEQSPSARVVDLGGGAGAYTRALLAADPEAHVTLVDAPEVIALARAQLGDAGDRVRLVLGDARDIHGTFEVALLANVLHLHGPPACAALCASAARMTAPGGRVVIVDLRRGSLEGELFALNMALYTDHGSVYDVAQLRAWLAAAGLSASEHRLASAPEMVVVIAQREAG